MAKTQRERSSSLDYDDEYNNIMIKLSIGNYHRSCIIVATRGVVKCKCGSGLSWGRGYRLYIASYMYNVYTAVVIHRHIKSGCYS
jgi:hypothetical protein